MVSMVEASIIYTVYFVLALSVSVMAPKTPSMAVVVGIVAASNKASKSSKID